MEIKYRAATKRQTLGRNLLSRKQDCCPTKFHKLLLFFSPIQTETHNPKRIYFALEITQKLKNSIQRKKLFE